MSVETAGSGGRGTVFSVNLVTDEECASSERHSFLRNSTLIEMLISYPPAPCQRESGQISMLSMAINPLAINHGHKPQAIQNGSDPQSTENSKISMNYGLTLNRRLRGSPDEDQKRDGPNGVLLYGPKWSALSATSV